MKDKHVKYVEALWIFDTKDVESVSDFWNKNANASDLRKDGESVENFHTKDVASVEIFSIKNAPIVKWFWYEYNNLVIIWKIW